MTLQFFPLSRFTVHGNSMLPALRPGQNVLVFNWAYIFFKPKKGDVIVLRKNGREMVKRIQGIYDREYFVQGDNQKESTDSRSFGAIKQQEIIGKVVLVMR